jgi:hypothetical protein
MLSVVRLYTVDNISTGVVDRIWALLWDLTTPKVRVDYSQHPKRRVRIKYASGSGQCPTPSLYKNPKRFKNQIIIFLLNGHKHDFYMAWYGKI